MIHKDVNIIFLGRFPYLHGMAGTKRIQHIIDVFKEYSNVNIKVIILQQNCKKSTSSGKYNGIPYQTVIPNSNRIKLLFFMPILYIKSCKIIRNFYSASCENILYIYWNL